ncbi:MAG: DinB family protein [Acidobacteriota bacterium]
MNPESAKTAAQFYVTDFENEMKTTTEVILAVPPNNSGYKPDRKSRTALELCRHIVLEDEWLLNGVVNGEIPAPPDQSDATGLMTPAQCAEYYNKTIPDIVARVRKLPGENLVRTINLMGILEMPAIAFLSMAVRHSVHHRGQLATYLRPMGGTVPSIYGPSADTPMG